MFVLKTRKSRRTRFFAVFMAINILAEIVSPTVAMALTSGPSQPEVESFEPVNTSEMVDLFGGDFKYNIPLMDVGGYPLNINYNSGVGMDQEATWVGLGWNLNAGAITRNMRGLPDDFNGQDAIKKEFNMKDNVSYGGHVKLGFEIFGWGKKGSSGGHANSGKLNVGLAINYNNYTGVGVEQSAGVSLGLSAGKSGSGKMNAGFGLTSSAKEGLDINQSVSFSANIDKKDAQGNSATGTSSSVGAGIAMGINSRSGLKQLSFNTNISASSSKKNSKEKTSSSNYGGSGSIGSSGAVSFNASTYVPSMQFPMTMNAVATNFKLGSTVFGADGSLDVGGFYSNQRLSTRELSLPAYGYMHSESGQDNDNALMDFNREKDGAYNRNMKKLPVTNYTYDVYSIAGQGVGGTYRPYRHDIGFVFDNEARTTNDSYTLGAEVDAAQTVHAGIDISVVDVNTVIGKWKDQNMARNALRFQTATGALGEKYSFKEVGEKSVNSDLIPFVSTGGFSPARVKLKGSGMGVSADDELEYFYPSGGSMASTPISTTNTKRLNRHKRNQVISTLTYAQAQNFGLQKDIYTNGINGAKAHHVAEVTILKTDGSRYVYGLPAYNKEQVESTFNVSGNTQSGTDFKNGLISYGGSDDSNANSKGIDHFFSRVTTPAYAHSYMLTAVVSPDYVDSDNITGPSDGDLGNYTKFEYSKIADYNWRTPIGAGKVNFNENTKKASLDDNYGSYVSGKRDMYYVSKIITKNYIAIFETGTREDALGVSSNGAVNSSDKSLLLKNIKLYARPEYEKQQTLGIANFRAVPIKVVNFVYNYELCPNVPNNSGAALSGVNYTTTNNAKGKLTLKQIYFTYGTSEKAKLNKYTFDYNTANNFAYDGKAYDRWGNYKPNTVGTSDPVAISGVLPNWEFPYTNQSSQANADSYSSAWSLTKIGLPSGADINIEYESDDYAYVQNLPAMNMCKATRVEDDGSTSINNNPAAASPITANSDKLDLLASQVGFASAGTPNDIIFFELPRPLNSSSIPSGTSSGDYFRDHYLKDLYGGRYLYFRFLVNMTKRSGNALMNVGDYFEYVSGYAEIDNTSYGFVTQNATGGVYTHGFVKLKGVPIRKGSSTLVNPIAKAAWQMGRSNFSSLVWDAAFNPSGGVVDVIKGLVTSNFVKNIMDGIKGPNLAIATKGYGNEVIMDKSWIRLYNGESKKFGGGCRVKKLTINDNWDDMTQQGGGSQKDFTYGQTYEYTTEENGTVISSGVAAYEPMMGGDEIPHRLPNYYSNQGNNPDVVNFLIPSDQFFTEEPYGESFFPSASVGYSNVKVANLKRVDPNNPALKIVKAHATGHVVHKFYTAKDYPTITSRTNIDKKPFKPPFGGLTKIFARDFMTTTQGHAIQVNDMHGKPKGMEVYAEDKTQPISTVEYKYQTFGANGYEEPSKGDILTDAKLKANQLANNCVVINPDGTVNDGAQIGVDYDMVADFRESKTTTVMGGAQINLSVFLVGIFPGLVPTIWPDFSRDVTRFRSAVTTKVIYRYGILEKTIATDLGSKVETSNLAYDSQTGEVLLTKTQNNFEDPVFNFTYPAHWSYDLMGQSYKNIGATVTNVSFTSGLSSTLLASDINAFVEGDEIAVGNAKAWVCSVNKTTNKISAIDANGNAIGSGATTVTVLRSGRRNQQSTPVGSIVSLANPVDIDANGVINSSISFGGTPAESKVIKTGSVEYADKWQIYPGHKEGTQGTCVCSVTDQGISMYNAMSTLLSNNVLQNNTIPGALLYNAGTSTLYQGFSNNLLLPNGTSCIYTGNNLNNHYWRMVYGAAPNVAEFEIRGSNTGTPANDVINCDQRCFVKAELPSGMIWSNIALVSLNSYSVVTNPATCNGVMQICANYTNTSVGSAKMNSTNNIILPSVVCFTITPGGKCYTFVNCVSTPSSSITCAPNVGDLVNPYFVGIKGNWRMVKSWSYLSDRSQSLSGTAPTKNTNIRTDGTFLTKDPSTGSTIKFQPFWVYNGTRFAENPLYWTFTSEVTKYSPFGMELENRDALSRYSSAVYGYNESLPLAVASNSRLQDVAYDGFEDYDFINPNNCKKKHFNFYESKANRTSTQSHTGLYSMEVVNGSSVVAKRKLPVACTPTMPSNCVYLLGCNDFLPLFSPTAQKYVLSYWVKEVDNSPSPTAPTLTYNYSSVSVATTSGPLTATSIVKTGIIDGWQRVEYTFDLPSGATGDFTVNLTNSAPNNLFKSYFDDIRIHPFNSNIKTFVYNPVNLKYVAELDANNFATFYEYNEEGSLIRVKKETEKGIMTIQETKNHIKF